MTFFRRLRARLARLFVGRGDAEPSTVTFTTASGLVHLTAAPGTPAGRGDAPQFVLEHWPQIAAAAFRGFRRLGAGCVVIRARAPRADDVAHPFRAHHVAYGPARGVWMDEALPETRLRAWVDEQVETYDVREGAVVVLLREAAAPLAYHVRAALTPPEALARTRPANN